MLLNMLWLSYSDDNENWGCCKQTNKNTSRSQWTIRISIRVVLLILRTSCIVFGRRYTFYFSPFLLRVSLFLSFSQFKLPFSFSAHFNPAFFGSLNFPVGVFFGAFSIVVEDFNSISNSFIIESKLMRCTQITNNIFDKLASTEELRTCVCVSNDNVMNIESWQTKQKPTKTMATWMANGKRMKKKTYTYELQQLKE